MTDNRGTLLTVYFLSLVDIWSESDAVIPPPGEKCGLAVIPVLEVGC